MKTYALAVAAVWMGLGCGAVAHAACSPPSPGVTRVQGVVRAAVDGVTVCIQTGADHAHLIGLRLSDVSSPRLTGPGGEGAKWALRRAARGKAVVCAVTAPGAGVCRIGQVSLADLLKAKAR